MVRAIYEASENMGCDWIGGDEPFVLLSVCSADPDMYTS